jgi:hypothetical protein
MSFKNFFFVFFCPLDVARVHEPLVLRGPNTATVYSSGLSTDAKQKDSHYKTNRIMNRGKGIGLTSIRRTDNGRISSKNPATIFKGHSSMLDSSKVLVR